MKLKAIYDVAWDSLQDYLDKYQEKVVHIIAYQLSESGSNNGKRFIVVVNEG